VTLWHYQWMILHEFLPHMVPQAVIEYVLTNGRHSTTVTKPFIGESKSSTDLGTEGCGHHTGQSMIRTHQYDSIGDKDATGRLAWLRLESRFSGGKLSSISGRRLTVFDWPKKESIQSFDAAFPASAGDVTSARAPVSLMQSAN